MGNDVRDALRQVQNVHNYRAFPNPYADLASLSNLSIFAVDW
jgi:hypothetical protein